jgi:hypothetical protein
MEVLLLIPLYLLPTAVVVIIFLIRRGFRLISEIETLQSELYDVKSETLERLENMLEEMRGLDIKGAFESDDEVGAVFNELKSLIEKYKDELN